MVRGKRKKSSRPPRSQTHRFRDTPVRPGLLQNLVLTASLMVLWGLTKLGGVIHSLVSMLLLGIITLLKQILISIKILSDLASTILHLPFPKLYHLSKNLRLKKRAPGRPRSLNRYLSRRLLTPRFLILAFFLFLSLYSLVVVNLVSQLPSPHRLNSSRPLTTQIFDRQGKLLYQIYEGQNRQLVTLDQIPQHLIQATLSIEDKHFFSHPGVDILAILRAAKAITFDKQIQGGSTLTQQLIKNTLLSPDQTISRKVKEIILAFWAERIFTKQQILQMYFNEAPYGGPAWGVAAAAQMYFGKKVPDLTLAESTYLAGLPAAPTQYSPYGSYPQKGKERQQEVLANMVDGGFITKEKAEEVSRQSLSFRPPFQNIKAPHFVMYVRDLLAQRYGEKTVSQGGLKITTTLDLDMQQMAEEILAEQLSRLIPLRVGNGAVMVQDPQSGQILAMVGSKDYFDPQEGNFNATLGLRQPGSSIKVATYATAFKQGFSPGTILLDTPVTFNTAGNIPYSPVNYDGKFHGPITLRTALGSSYNVPAVKLLSVLGVDRVIESGRSLGITTWTNPQNYGLSLTLGGAEVKMIDMMTVYGTLASGGIKHPPQPILTVTDSLGNVLEDYREDSSGQRAISEEVAYLLTHILSDNGARTPAFGPSSPLLIPGYSVAVKTGTSDNKRDNWTFGYTPNLVVGVWVGNMDNSPMDPSLTSGITGAAPIWHEIMANLLQARKEASFPKPEGIMEGAVDGKRDLIIAGVPPKRIVTYQKVKQKDDKGEEKETITYSDPFTKAYADQAPKPN